MSEAVKEQILTLSGLNWRLLEQSSEGFCGESDMQIAGYAAALKVLTSYSTIDRQPLDRDLYRKLAKGERTMIRDLVDYAAQVANGMLVPTDFSRDMWRDLGAPERFYVRMLDMEAKGSAKVADFQNFAKSFAFAPGAACGSPASRSAVSGIPRARPNGATIRISTNCSARTQNRTSLYTPTNPHDATSHTPQPTTPNSTAR